MGAEEAEICLLGVYHHEDDASDGFVDLGERGFLSVVCYTGEGSDCLYIKDNTAIRFQRNNEQGIEEEFISRFPEDVEVLNEHLVLTRGDEYIHIWDVDTLYQNQQLDQHEEPGLYVHGAEILETESFAQVPPIDAHGILSQFRQQSLQFEGYVSTACVE